MRLFNSVFSVVMLGFSALACNNTPTLAADMPPTIYESSDHYLLIKKNDGHFYFGTKEKQRLLTN